MERTVESWPPQVVAKERPVHLMLLAVALCLGGSIGTLSAAFAVIGALADGGLDGGQHFSISILAVAVGSGWALVVTAPLAAITAYAGYRLASSRPLYRLAAGACAGWALAILILGEDPIGPRGLSGLVMLIAAGAILQARRSEADLVMTPREREG